MRTKEQQIRDWFAKVASDLKIARTESGTAAPATDAVCFHCQQAVEKMLKAWLIWKDRSPVWTHNIEVLLAACEETDAGFADLRRAETLTGYAVDVRYGDPPYFPTLQEMEEAAKLAETAKAFIVGRFAEEGVDLGPSGEG